MWLLFSIYNISTQSLHIIRPCVSCFEYNILYILEKASQHDPQIHHIPPFPLYQIESSSGDRQYLILSHFLSPQKTMLAASVRVQEPIYDAVTRSKKVAGRASLSLSPHHAPILFSLFIKNKQS